MPSTFGELDALEREKAERWLQEKWPISACPFHGPTVWQIGNLVQTIPYSGGDFNLGGPTYPLLSVICMTCGYTVFVNAVIAGVVSSSSPSEHQST
jgi:hypothetical protein